MLGPAGIDLADLVEHLARMNDLVSFILFLEATDPAGERVQDARRLVLREGRLYHFDPDAFDASGAGCSAASAADQEG